MEEQKRKNNMAKRIEIYILGVFLLALGVSVSVKSDLGVSPVNSIPYVLSLITGIEQGKCVIMVFIGFIGLQALILLKEFEVKRLLQIICSTVFGYFVTATNYLTAGVPECTNYVMQLIYLLISMVIIAAALSLFFFHELRGVREGTLIAAICIGQIMKVWNRFTDEKLTKFLEA